MIRMSCASSEPVVVIGKLPAKVENIQEIHYVPCKFDYTGPADVSGYFLRERGSDGIERACLRGRGLEGGQQLIPTDYKMAILKTRNQGVICDIECTTDSFQLWEHGRTVGERSAVARALSSLPIAKALASDD